MSIPWRRSGLRRATEGQREKDHLQDEQRGADPMEQAESSGSGLGGRAHRLDRGGHGEGGYRRAEPCEQWSDGTPRAAERNRADHRKGGQRQRRRVQPGEHRADKIRRQLPPRVFARERRDVAREHDLRGHGGEEQLRPEQGSTGKPIEEPRHDGVLRYVRPRMQGDMDIVDPLIDDYLTRLAGSPDPVEAEMRRYADERDGYPIVGQTVGTLLGQLATVVKARRVFEVGSGFGYSAFWLARALDPGGAGRSAGVHSPDLRERRTGLDHRPHPGRTGHHVEEVAVSVTAAQVKARAAQLGFDLCGIARAHPLPPEPLDRWLARGWDAGMEYVRRRRAERLDPALLVPD